jgi:hypothetical protein
MIVVQSLILMMNCKAHKQMVPQGFEHAVVGDEI